MHLQTEWHTEYTLIPHLINGAYTCWGMDWWPCCDHWQEREISWVWTGSDWEWDMTGYSMTSSHSPYPSCQSIHRGTKWEREYFYTTLCKDQHVAIALHRLLSTYLHQYHTRIFWVVFLRELPSEGMNPALTGLSKLRPALIVRSALRDWMDLKDMVLIGWQEAERGQTGVTVPRSSLTNQGALWKIFIDPLRTRGVTASRVRKRKRLKKGWMSGGKVEREEEESVY